MLEVGPTVAAPGVVANEHGDWTIKVSGVGVGVKIDAYVARTDPNMGVTTGAKSSLFIDPIWERSRSAAAGCTFVDGEFDNTGSLVSRYGTLNGIATANDSAVHVAGGYVLLDGRKSPYSSAGPSRDYPVTPRFGPDYVLPCDESYALAGMLAGGTRSGSVFRLIGTSNAAPELARLFTKYIGGTLPNATNIPATQLEREKRGGGDLPTAVAQAPSAMAGPRLPASLAQSSGDRRKPAARGLAEHIRSAKDLTRNMNYRSPLTPSAGFGS